MFGNERQNQILRLLQRDGTVAVQALAAQLYASEATIRRDLAAMEQHGLVRRIHGGAVAAGGADEVPLFLRERERHAEKAAIARQALAYIRDGATIIMDASSTVCHLVPLLTRFEGLTVITNGPKTSMALAAQHIKNICTGGVLLDNSLACVGSHAEQCIRGIQADLVFFSCRGLSDEGRLSDASLEETCIRQVMLAHARQRICLCDASKLGRDYLHTLCQADMLDAVLCDAPLPFACKKA